MRLPLFVLLLILAGCSSPEQDARKLLTEAQQLQLQFQSVEALDALNVVAKKYPSTEAATEALRLAKPLNDQKEFALAACGNYFLDTGQDPSSEDDLLRDPGIAGWKGPYAKRGQMGAFAKWAVSNKCVRS